MDEYGEWLGETAQQLLLCDPVGRIVGGRGRKVCRLEEDLSVKRSGCIESDDHIQAQERHVG
jgi:hypothetical protein